VEQLGSHGTVARNLKLETFITIRQKNENCLQVGKESGILYEDLSTFHIVDSGSSLFHLHDKNGYANAQKC
jgi:hypothetical protein